MWLLNCCREEEEMKKNRERGSRNVKREMKSFLWVDFDKGENFENGRGF